METLSPPFTTPPQPSDTMALYNEQLENLHRDYSASTGPPQSSYAALTYSMPATHSAQLFTINDEMCDDGDGGVNTHHTTATNRSTNNTTSSMRNGSHMTTAPQRRRITGPSSSNISTRLLCNGMMLTPAPNGLLKRSRSNSDAGVERDEYYNRSIVRRQQVQHGQLQPSNEVVRPRSQEHQHQPSDAVIDEHFDQISKPLVFAPSPRMQLRSFSTNSAHRTVGDSQQQYSRPTSSSNTPQQSPLLAHRLLKRVCTESSVAPTQMPLANIHTLHHNHLSTATISMSVPGRAISQPFMHSSRRTTLQTATTFANLVDKDSPPLWAKNAMVGYPSSNGDQHLIRSTPASSALTSTPADESRLNNTHSSMLPPSTLSQQQAQHQSSHSHFAASSTNLRRLLSSSATTSPTLPASTWRQHHGKRTADAQTMSTDEAQGNDELDANQLVDGATTIKRSRVSSPRSVRDVDDGDDVQTLVQLHGSNSISPSPTGSNAHIATHLSPLLTSSSPDISIDNHRKPPMHPPHTTPANATRRLDGDGAQSRSIFSSSSNLATSSSGTDTTITESPSTSVDHHSDGALPSDRSSTPLPDLYPSANVSTHRITSHHSEPNTSYPFTVSQHFSLMDDDAVLLDTISTSLTKVSFGNSVAADSPRPTTALSASPNGHNTGNVLSPATRRSPHTRRLSQIASFHADAQHLDLVTAPFIAASRRTSDPGTNPSARLQQLQRIDGLSRFLDNGESEPTPQTSTSLISTLVSPTSLAETICSVNSNAHSTASSDEGCIMHPNAASREQMQYTSNDVMQDDISTQPASSFLNPRLQRSLSVSSTRRLDSASTLDDIDSGSSSRRPHATNFVATADTDSANDSLSRSRSISYS